MVRETTDWNLFKNRERVKLVELYKDNASIIREPHTLSVTNEYTYSQMDACIQPARMLCLCRYHVLRNLFIGKKNQLDGFRLVSDRV